MGNNLGKTIQKKEVLTKLSPTQRSYIESWYCTLCDEQTRMIAQSDFVKDVKKRFANIPEPIVSSLSECMNPDSKCNIREDAFFYMAYIILNGSLEERMRLSFMIIQNLGNDSEVTVGSLLHFSSLVNTSCDGDDVWSEKRVCESLSVTADSNTILSWKDFYSFCSRNPTCPIVSWMTQFRKSVEESCILYQKLVDSQDGENQRMSKVYYTTKKTIIYNHIHEMSVTVLLDIYGTLMRSGNGGYITKAQWYTEMSKFFPQQLVQNIFWDFSEEQESISVSVVVSAMCLLCHDSLDRRISAALLVFNNTTRSAGKFTHTDLVELFSLGVKMFDVDNSFDCIADDNDETDNFHIRMKRRLSQDDESHHSNIVSLVDTIFNDVKSKLPLHQRSISSADLIDWIVQHPSHYEFLTHQLRRDFSRTPSREEEHAAYRQQYTEFNNSMLVANRLFYIVARSWWSAWVQYIHSGEDSRYMCGTKPGRIDNSRLVEEDGNRLRWDLTEKEYVIVNELLWSMLYEWYGGGPVVSRRVVRSLNGSLELEMHPLFLHVCLCLKDGTHGEEFDRMMCTKVLIVEKVKTRICQIARKDPARCRLWVLNDGDLILLKEEKKTLEQLQLREELFVMLEEVQENGKYLLDEEGRTKQKTREGLVGLENLGYTCYMNAALQCLFHTPLLRDYFLSNKYLAHINTESTFGSGGDVASSFGELIQNIWNTSSRVLAPRLFFNCFQSHETQFYSNAQHDSQEFLATLLDVLGEDLNLCKERKCAAISDAGCSDKELAERYWLDYTSREKSVITALFCGQFQSHTQCVACSHVSSTYESFTMLQLPLPVTEMKWGRAAALRRRAISVVLSFTNGRLPMQCSIRVPADSSIQIIKEAVNALDASIDLSASRIHLAYVKDSIIVEDRFDSSFRLNQYDYSDYTLFVLPPEGNYLGARGFEEYSQHHAVNRVKVGQAVRLAERLCGAPLTGTVKQVLADFCFVVSCSDGKERTVVPTDLEGGEAYLPQPGDFVFVVIKGSKAFTCGTFLGVSPKSPHHCCVHLYPSDKEVIVSLKRLSWRTIKPHNVYLIQRYLDINDGFFLGYLAPTMTGVPQIIEIVPEFTTGRQLYNFVHKHFKKILNNPVTQTAVNTLNVSKPSLTRMSAIRSHITHCSSVHTAHSLCSSYLDSDTHMPDMPSSFSKSDSCDSDSSSDRNEYRSYVRKHEVKFDPNRSCGQVKEEDAQAQIAQAYGFTLKLVDDSGRSCLMCHWLKGCTGCVIPADDTPLYCLASSRKIAIDWDPTFLMNHHQVLYDYLITHNSVESVSLAGKQSILLQECLQRFVQTEVLQGDQRPRCEEKASHLSQCQANINHYHAMCIWRPPPILIIHLKRFKYTNGGFIKLKSNVEFPLKDLDLEEFVAKEKPVVPEADLRYWEALGGKREKKEKEKAIITEPDGQRSPFPKDGRICTKYDLYAVVNHIGQMDSGHYVSMIQESEGNWYVMNDARVMQVSVSQVMNPDAYMLFYVRQDVEGVSLSTLFSPDSEEGNGQSGESAVESEKDDKKCAIL